VAEGLSYSVTKLVEGKVVGLPVEREYPYLKVGECQETRLKAMARLAARIAIGSGTGEIG
jgi:hypothetical protein